MLVLSRKVGECISIGKGIELMVVSIKGGRVRLGISAPRSVPVHRGEVQREIDEGERQKTREQIQRLRTAT